jgi:SAM-dependent methyltransferase
VLYRYASYLGSYTGLDIAPGTLTEARARAVELDEQYGGRPFDIDFLECDVAQQWPNQPPFDVAVYTSALEHLPRELGIGSLRETAGHLGDGGVLLLSTPNTAGTPQHRVHVYEWHTAELVPVLESIGLRVLNRIGLLPPEAAELSKELARQFGPEATAWHERLRELVPAEFLGPVVAAATPGIATEVMYVCGRR